MGFDNDGDNITQDADYSFWNPKAGITYSLQPEHQFYASYAIGNREPVRDDFTESTPASRPKHETLRNVEAGYRGVFGVGELFGTALTADVEANYFYMNYKNQLVLTGQINDVGAYTRTNIDKSYRQGIEFAGTVSLGSRASVRSSITYSENKIEDFTEFVDATEVVDGEEQYYQVENTYNSSSIAFSPDWITNTHGSGSGERSPCRLHL
ncbi:hypothetical protein GCM10028895_40280 [Pontibacter rugosus]